MSVKRAQSEIDSAEFTEWMAYRMICPFGDDLLKRLFAFLLSWLLNAQGVRKSKSDNSPYTWREMVPDLSDFDEITEPMVESEEETIQKQKSIGSKLRSFFKKAGMKSNNGNASNSSPKA